MYCNVVIKREKFINIKLKYDKEVVVEYLKCDQINSGSSGTFGNSSGNY